MSAIRDYFFPVNPYTQRREFHLLSENLEASAGAISYPLLIAKSGGKITKNDKNINYREYVSFVERIRDRIAREAKHKNFHFEFTVINSQELNAWCLPGGGNRDYSWTH